MECLEMLAARRAVIFAKELGLQQAHWEGDSESVIKALQKGDMLFSSFGHIVKEIQFHVSSSLRSFYFSHIGRQSNAVACTLA